MSKNETSIQIKVPSDMYHAIKKMAERSDRTIQDQARRYLKTGILLEKFNMGKITDGSIWDDLG